MWAKVASRRLVIVAGLVVSMAIGIPASGVNGFVTETPVGITVLAAGGTATAIISSGDEIGDFVFEGIPDGVGVMPGTTDGTVDVFVTHEQSRVPFRRAADFVDSSVSKLTIDVDEPSVVDASVPLGPEAGFIRFCSAFLAGPAEGFAAYTFFVNEESNDILEVPHGAGYTADPALAGRRQAGYAVVLDAATGAYTQVEGMGRYNHENSVVVPGGWPQIAVLSTDDTFSAPSSQLYMYLAADETAIWKDKGSMWAFRVTGTQDGQVDGEDPFNGANDYLDISPGDTFKGEFIRVPKDIARGDTGVAPQTALENWSNENNVFQFIRLEDLAYDPANPRIVYVADTGADRVVPNPATGRMYRPSGVSGLADNGRIFAFEMNRANPRKVDRFWVVAQGDSPTGDAYVPFRAPDNVAFSSNSFMVQEDANPGAKVWRLDLVSGGWSHVATVIDPAGESSGIVDASQWFGEGAWLLTLQQHGSNESFEQIGDVLFKRENGQLVLMTIPGS